MDYGDRHERACLLISNFRAKGDIIHVCGDHLMTGALIADEIEFGTNFGRSLVTVAGFLLPARATTPWVFNKNEITPEHR